MNKLIPAVLVLTIAASLDVGAQDVRSKVGPVSGTSLSNIIDPDKSVYGVEMWGSSEDEFVSRFGNPTGYIRLNASETVMLYGKSHAFIFTASKLSGLRISMTMLDWKVSQSILTLTPFDGIGWQLLNGIRGEMNLAEVKKILGESLKAERVNAISTLRKRALKLISLTTQWKERKMKRTKFMAFTSDTRALPRQHYRKHRYHQDRLM